MARGYPDYLNTAGQVSIKTLDNSDLFAIGFGIDRLDSRGTIIFADNWKDGLSGYIIENTNTPGYPQILHQNALLGGGCLYSPAPAGVNQVFNYIRKAFSMAAAMRMGFEFAYRHLTLGCSWRMIYYYTGVGGLYQSWLDYTLATREIRVRTPSGFVVVYTLPLAVFNTYYIRIKIVCDFITGKYDHLLVGSVQIDLRSYDMYFSVGTGNDILEFSLYSFLDRGTAQVSQIGYIILTGDEP